MKARSAHAEVVIGLFMGIPLARKETAYGSFTFAGRLRVAACVQRFDRPPAFNPFPLYLSHPRLIFLCTPGGV